MAISRKLVSLRWTTLLVVVAAMLVETTTAWGAVRVGREFPSFDAKDALTGDRFSLEDLRGKVVLVDFWATWCGPCVAEVPNVRRVYKKYQDRGFEIVSISLDSKRSKFRSYVKRNGMSWYHVMEGGGWKTRLAKKYGIRSIPKMYLLDHRGVVISDSARGHSLEKLVAAAIKKVPEGTATATTDTPRRQKSRTSGRELGANLAKARAELKDVVKPLDEMDEVLGELERQVESLQHRMLEPDAGRRERRGYEQLREELARVRCRLFVCGALAERVPLPAEAFTEGKPARRSEFVRAAGQLPVATGAIDRLRMQLERVRGELREMDEALDQLAREVGRDGGSSRSMATKSKAAVRATGELVSRCQDSWKRQLTKARKMIEADAAPSDTGSSPLADLEAKIDACRDLLQGLSMGDVGASEVRRSLDGICTDLEALVAQAVQRGAVGADTIKLPTNPMRGGSSNIRTRLAAAVQLDVARDALSHLETVGAGNAEADALREELAALEKATRTARGERELSDLEERFTELAGRLLAMRDRFVEGG